MKLELCYAPSACSLVPYVTLTEAGAAFDVRIVNLPRGDTRTKEYLGINPLHRVPVLIVDGRPLTENVAIQVFIARAFPAAKLLPTDALGEARAISLMAWFASGIHPPLSRYIRPSRYCDAENSADSMRRLAGEAMRESFQVADDLLNGRDYFFERFTAPDAYFYWCFRRATQFKLEVADFRNCIAHFERMQQRKSIQKVLEFEAGVLKSFASAAD